MTNEEILNKAIEKAIKNGFKPIHTPNDGNMKRKHIAKTENWKYPKDKEGNRVAGWFIDPKDGVFFITPNVRGMGRLTLHTIDNNGEVNASVLVRGVGYDGKDAEYHEFVILDDWDSSYHKDAGKVMPDKVLNLKSK